MGRSGRHKEKAIERRLAVTEMCAKEANTSPIATAAAANGARALARATQRRDLPVLAVGDATARAAREAGFESVTSAGGDVGDLAPLAAARCAPSAAATSG